MASKPIDPILIVGAGLTGSLIALALRKLRPDAPFILIEQSARCGGGPVQPFFWESVPPSERWLIDALVVRQWPSYAIAVPDFVRSFAGPISMIIPEQIHAEIVESVPQSRLRLGAKAVHIDQKGVVLSNGQTLEGCAVIDARAEAIPALTGTHWCHETSRMVRFPQPHALATPIVVDATLTAPDRTFLQYYPVDPVSLLIRYVCYSRAATNRRVSDMDKGSSGGRLLSETKSRRALLGGQDSPRQGISPGYVSARSTQAAYWNPVMSDCVGGAVRIATAFAAAQVLSNAGLAVAVSELGTRARERKLQSGQLIEALCSEKSRIQHHALHSLYGLGKDCRGRFESGVPLEDDFERLDAQLRRLTRDSSEVAVRG